MSASNNPRADRGMPWPQMLALAFGAVYLLIGIVGFFITGFDNFFGNEVAPGVHHADENLLNRKSVV